MATTEKITLIDEESPQLNIQNGINPSLGNGELNSPTSSDSSASSQENLLPNDEVEGDHMDKLCCGYKKKDMCIIALFSLLLFFGCLCFFMLAPFYPQEAVEKGLNSGTIGWVISAFPIGEFIAVTLSGIYMVRIGVKCMFASGAFLNSISVIAFGFLKYAPPGAVFTAFSFILRFTMAFGGGMFMATGTALCITLYPDKTSTIYGLTAGVSSIGAMLGPVLGGALYQVGGFVTPFVVMGGVLFTFTVIATAIMPNTDHVEAPHTTPRDYLRLFRHGPIFMAAVVIMLHGVLLGFAEPTLALFLKKYFKLEASLIGLVYLVSILTYAIGSVIFGFVLDKTGIRRPFMITGVFLSALGIVLTGQSQIFGVTPGNDLWMIFLGMFVAGLGCVGLTIGTPADMLAYATLVVGYPEHINTNALVSAAFFAPDMFGYFIGPLFGGYISHSVGFQSAVTIIGGVFVFIGVVIGGIYTITGSWLKPRKPAERTINGSDTALDGNVSDQKTYGTENNGYSSDDSPLRKRNNTRSDGTDDTYYADDETQNRNAPKRNDGVINHISATIP
ncbi:MFS-type transporter SLC18B1-like [Tubulanus polymorphus]|uniref:MFS-type transporter SLC18B1-like n=1 Tax=Tubulanus polymorphus TaxID=672921 RepID=UPI003DA66D81